MYVFTAPKGIFCAAFSKLWQTIIGKYLTQPYQWYFSHTKDLILFGLRKVQVFKEPEYFFETENFNSVINHLLL